MINIDCKDNCKAQENMGNQCCYFCSKNKECESQNRCKKDPVKCDNSNSR